MSTSVSPILTTNYPLAYSTKFLLSTGSNTGLKISPTSSITKANPFLILSSKLLEKSLSVYLTTFIFFCSIFLIQRFACSCGSIISGYLYTEVTSIALFTLISSVGNPAMFHSLITIGSPITCYKL